jgi:hypothetical protein
MSIRAEPVRRYGERGRPAAAAGTEEDRMKYMLTIFGPEGGQEELSPDEAMAAIQPWYEYDQKARQAGVFVAGEGLAESSTATTVRIGANGERILTDGPFAESKEVLGGFYVLDCKDLDEALDWAKQLPVTEGAVVEVRPVMDYGVFGDEGTQAGG